MILDHYDVREQDSEDEDESNREIRILQENIERVEGEIRASGGKV